MPDSSLPAPNPVPESASGLKPFAQLAEQLGAALARTNALLEQLSTPATQPSVPDWDAAAAKGIIAWRWRTTSQGAGYLQPVPHAALMHADDVQEVDSQKARLFANTAQFVAGRPANHALLTGARGTGKSSLIKACLQAFAPQGLRLIEVDKTDLLALADISALIAGRPEKFLIYCDDLSFDTGERGYQALKSALDGSISAQGNNLLIYATSNRRHLLPETMRDNQSYQHSPDGELHPGEAVEEKIALSDRFGLWLSFYSFSQEQYLAIVRHWLAHYGASAAQLAQAQAPALLWALERGARSGRVARQFAQDWAGRNTA